MNQMAIAIKLNDRQFLIGAQWPTRATLKAIAQFKRKAQEALAQMVTAIIPMPQVAAS